MSASGPHPASLRIVAPSYLREKASSKPDLLRRLHKLQQVLREDEQLEPDHLAGTASMLPEFFSHKDKQVRLLALNACLEILSVFAPDCPYDEREILLVFRQLVTQLSSLATVTDPSHDYYVQYERILASLAHVRTGVILVEACKDCAAAHAGSPDSDRDLPSEQEAMELLAEFVQALLHCLRHDHPPTISELAAKAIAAVVDEYEPQSVPIPVLDELLLCIGQGPFIYITQSAAAATKSTDSAKKMRANKKGTPASQTSLLVQTKVPNPSYLCAAKVITSTLNRLSTPIAGLLNGLLDGDPQTVERSNISIEPPNMATANADAPSSHHDSVYTIIRQLFHIAQSILTTVIGTISNGLVNQDEVARLAATKLLGDLFAASLAKTSGDGHHSLASDFRLVFKDWLGRRNDMSVAVRRCMVDCLVKILSVHGASKSDTTTTATSSQWTSRDDVSQTLTTMVKEDPDVNVRMDAVYAVSDWVYRSSNPSDIQVSPALLQAIGTRVSSKHKEERKNALTGLAQVYFRQYLREKVKPLLPKGDGDDGSVDISNVLEVLHEACDLRFGKRANRKSRKGRAHRGSSHDALDEEDDYKDIDDETYGWIPSKIFECAYFTDVIDSDMRSRVIQVIDEVLLGNDASSASSKHLSSTARAVGFTMILHAISGGDLLVNQNEVAQTNAFKYMRQLFGHRAALQKVLYAYLEARVAMKELTHGSEEFFTAQANALELLDKVAALAPPAPGNDASKVLEEFHKARDKHIFRQFAMVVDPKQSNKVRAKALDDLPKRTKAAASDASSVWVKNLVRRCCMGDFINASVVSECVRLAHECFMEQDVTACAALVSSVKVMIDIFPSLGGIPETFSNLTELFSNCRAIDDMDMKKELDETGVLTTLSSILAVAAPEPKASEDTDMEETVSNSQFQQELMQLCIRDGTPEQARHAVYTLAKLLVPKDSSTQSAHENNQAFSHLLASMTAPSKLTISGSESSSNLVRILCALSALSECASEVLLTSERGQRAMKFALETVVMGRNRSYESSQEDMADDAEPKTPHSGRKQKSVGSARKHITPEMAASLLEDDNLSVTCRTLCAAIDFLVCSIRSAFLSSRNGNSKSNGLRKQVGPFIAKVFDHLIQIVRDQGLPPSDSDRQLCKARQDRAALRQCAAVHLFRLCDARLGLEERYVDTTAWHCLADVLLDEERVVREACMEELSMMIKGKGVYSSANSRPASPSLRFVSMIVFCIEGDGNTASGNAAKVGKILTTVKSAALASVTNLRKVCDAYYNQCKANDREQDFETAKTGIMPEYMVPYAVHLLTHRRETPFAGVVVDADADPESQALADDEAQYKILRKRLRMLLEPLIVSLGDNADNISFLLRMMDMLGKSFRPVDVAPGFGKLTESRLSLDSAPHEIMEDTKRQGILEAKLKSVSAAAREVLMGFVKKDNNLDQYPGIILLPSFLFKKTKGRLPKERQPDYSGPLSTQENASSRNSTFKTGSPDDSKRKRSLSPPSSSKSPTRRSEQPTQKSSATKSDHGTSPKPRNVHFSPEVQFRPSRSAHQSVLSAETGSEHFGDVSPIAQSGSPTPSDADSSSQGTRRSQRLSCSASTLGTTPPSIFRGSTFQSTAPNTSSSRKSLPQGSNVVQSQTAGPTLRPKISSEDSGAADDEGTAPTQSQASDATESVKCKSQEVDRTTIGKMRSSTRGQKRATASQGEASSSINDNPKRIKKTESLKSRQPINVGVPAHIKINRVEMPPSSMDSDRPTGGKKIANKRRGARTAKSEDSELDFDFENKGNRATRKVDAKKTLRQSRSAKSRSTRVKSG